MAKQRENYEERFYRALLRIKSYMTPEQLRRQSEKKYALSYEEALEMTYDNVVGEAISALHGYRKRRVKTAPAADAVARSTDRDHEPTTRA